MNTQNMVTQTAKLTTVFLQLGHEFLRHIAEVQLIEMMKPVNAYGDMFQLIALPYDQLL